MNFYDNFVRRCVSVGKSPSGVALEIGLAKPTVNRWKNGGGVTDATARKVADYFGVSVEELMESGGSETKKTAGQMADGRGMGFENLYGQLTPENQKMIDALIDSLLKSQSGE